VKIFVTGGAGFIGSQVCEIFLKEGHQVTAYDNLVLGRKELLKESLKYKSFQFIEADLLDLERLKKEIAGYELVYHLAANSDISQGASTTTVDLQNGTLATYNTLEAMRLCGVKQMIFASTSAVYGESTIKPTPENYGPLMPISFYGASKLACEALCSAFSHNFDIKIWVYRFANIVGPHSTHGAIHDFVARLLKNPKRLEVLGNGTQRKSYLHVSDCINAMRFGYENCKDDFQIFNLASEGVTSVKFIAEEVVRLIGAYSGVKADLEFGESDRGWRGDVAYTYLTGELFAAKGWRAKLKSDEAVSRAIQEIIAEKTLS
jgi:UDP-glucose 4-epimerase